MIENGKTETYLGNSNEPNLFLEKMISVELKWTSSLKGAEFFNPKKWFSSGPGLPVQNMIIKSIDGWVRIQGHLFYLLITIFSFRFNSTAKFCTEGEILIESKASANFWKCWLFKRYFTYFNNTLLKSNFFIFRLIIGWSWLVIYLRIIF